MAGTTLPSLTRPLDDEGSRAATLENLYGSAVALSREVDVQLLSQFRRPPGLPSSFLGLRSLTSQLEQCPWPEMVMAAASSAAPRGLSEACAQGAVHHEETVSPFTVAHEAMERDVGLVGAPLKACETGSAYVMKE